jgi:CubicO group peptidase (beta-lactamase class C family)
LIRTSLILVLAFALALALWVYGPGSGHSQGELFSLFDQESRVEIFSNLHHMKPSQAVSASSKPRLFHRIPASIEASYTWKGREKSLDDFLDETASMGMMVLIDGGIVEERYAPGIDQESLISTWTALQTYLTTLVAIGIQQGVIESLDDPVKKYAQDFDGTDYGDVTVRDLLNGRSGMDAVPRTSSLIPETVWTYMDLLRYPESPDETALTMKSRAKAEEGIHAIATDPHVLGAVIQGAWGHDRSLVDILQEELWTPLGFGGQAYWVQDAAGNVLTRCCLSTRLLEFAQLGQIHLEHGSFRTEQYLPTDWPERRKRSPLRTGTEDNQGPTPGHGMGFQGLDDAQAEFITSGAFGQSLWIDHENQIVIAQLSSGHGGEGPSLEEKLRAYRAIAEAAQAQRPYERVTSMSQAEESTHEVPNERHDPQ